MKRGGEKVELSNLLMRLVCCCSAATGRYEHFCSGSAVISISTFRTLQQELRMPNGNTEGHRKEAGITNTTAGTTNIVLTEIEAILKTTNKEGSEGRFAVFHDVIGSRQTCFACCLFLWLSGNMVCVFELHNVRLVVLY